MKTARPTQKKENLQRALDKLKDKYGKDTVQSASVMKSDLFG